MKSCKICANEDCTWRGHTDHISVGCLGFEPQTNADSIRGMTDEELALYIHNAEAQAADTGRADTVESWLDWLKSPVEVKQT